MKTIIKKVFQWFSTLVIPDHGRISTDINALIDVAEQIGKPIDLLHLSNSKQMLNEFYKNFKGSPLI